MNRTLAAGLVGFGLLLAPASAAPLGPVAMPEAADAVTQVQYYGYGRPYGYGYGRPRYYGGYGRRFHGGPRFGYGRRFGYGPRPFYGPRFGHRPFY